MNPVTRKANMFVLTVFLTALFLVRIPVSLQNGPIVSTSSGKIRGELLASRKVNQFLGIPYAEQKRFQAPESFPAWTGIRNSTKFGARCPQFDSGGEKENEDCLFLNVYTPSSATVSSGLTVMFWIHGGSYFVGSGNSYPGIMYASSHDVILVNINYRLGVLGFFNVPGTEIKGNYGMFDQIMALKWVKKNIKNFGGDPEKVTVFGASAGSASVSLLAMSPLTKNLFSKAIMQSGSALAEWAHKIPDEGTPKEFAKSLNCPEIPKSDLINCIKGKSALEILYAQPGLSSIDSPVVDKHFLTDTPRRLLENGDFHSIPVMMGTSVNEADLFLVSYFNHKNDFNGNLASGISKSDREKYIKYLLDNEKESVKEAVLFEYSDNACLEADCPLTNRQLASDAHSDFSLNAAVDFELKARSQRAQVYSYLYRYAGTTTRQDIPSWISVTHGSELEYVFGFPMLQLKEYTDNDRKVSRMMMKLWTNFAKYGDPNHDSFGVVWPKFEKTGVNGTSYLSINLQPSVEKLYKPHKNAFWNSYVHKLRNECKKDERVSSVSYFRSDFLLIIPVSTFLIIFMLN